MPHTTTLSSFTPGRLSLVPPSAADDEAVSILRSHPETRKHLRYLPPYISPAQVAERRTSRNKNTSIIDFHVHLPDGAFAGMCGLSDVDTLNDKCSIGILISPEFHRGGLATETLYTLLKYAFEEKGMHRVAFDTGVDNAAMRGWLERVVGAKLEFTWRECWKDAPGVYSDVVGYSILAWEWNGTVKEKLEARLAVAKQK